MEELESWDDMFHESFDRCLSNAEFEFVGRERRETFLREEDVQERCTRNVMPFRQLPVFQKRIVEKLIIATNSTRTSSNVV
jgi:hypothetical protein